MIVMPIGAYLAAVKECLLTDPFVIEFQIVRERQTIVDAHLRVRLRLADHSLLEFSEYVQRTPDDEIHVITYSYHWADEDGNLIRRWDNTPHFPDLPGFPHHIHDGATSAVTAGAPIDIFQVLKSIGQSLQTKFG